MSVLTNLKAAFSRVLHLGESEAHAVITAIEADAQPLLAAAEQRLTAAEDRVITEVKTELADVKAKLEQLLGQQPAPAPAPAEPPAQS